MNRYWPFINPYDEPVSNIPLLREAFADWKIGYGIFDALEFIGADLPWKDSAESITLDIEYFGNRSGGKLVAPVIMNLLGEATELTESDRVLLARIIWTKFGEPWKHLWATNEISYNPIHNYNMSDVRTLVRGDSASRVDSGETSQSTEHGKTNDTLFSTFGMNSIGEDGKPSDKSHSEDGGEDVTSGEDSRKSDSVAARSETETTNRSGNIGVTTTQQMMESERNLWMWNFFDQVYKDIDSVLSLPIYDPCRI